MIHTRMIPCTGIPTGSAPHRRKRHHALAAPFLHPPLFLSLLLPLVFLSASPAVADRLPFTADVDTLARPEWSETADGATVIQTRLPDESGVRFLFSNVVAATALVRDAFPVMTSWGQVPASHANGDFSNRSGFALRLRNTGPAGFSAALFLNTGFTGPSGTPPYDPANDTFWSSGWTWLDPGQSLRLLLDFDNAVPWNVADNPSPHTLGGTDGLAMPINAFDRTEVSSIGFQIATGGADASLVASPAGIPEPGTASLLLLGAALAFSRRTPRNGL